MTITIENQELNVDINEEQVLKAIGYDFGSTAPARLLSLVNELARINLGLIEPSYSYIIRDIEAVTGDTVIIDEKTRFRSQTVSDLLRTCQKTAIFVLTIDDCIEKTAAGLAEEGSVLKASVLDAIGSHAVEQLTEQLEGIISDEVARDNLVTGRRISPGHCDWEVNQQEVIFRMLDDNSAGVRLTDDYLMLPRKSVSGIIGIGSGDEVTNYNPCITCVKLDCPGRKGTDD